VTQLFSTAALCTLDDDDAGAEWLDACRSRPAASNDLGLDLDLDLDNDLDL